MKCAVIFSKFEISWILSMKYTILLSAPPPPPKKTPQNKKQKNLPPNSIKYHLLQTVSDFQKEQLK